MHRHGLAVVLTTMAVGCLGPGAGGCLVPVNAGDAGATVLLESLSVACMTGDASHLYWLTKSGVLVRYDKDTAALEASTVARLATTCGMTVRGSTLFVASSDGVKSGMLQQIDVTAPAWPTASRALIVGLGEPNSVAADDTYAYVGEYEVASLRRCAIANPQGNDACVGDALVGSGLNSPRSVVQNDTSLALVNADGTVMSVNKTTGQFHTLVATPNVALPANKVAFGPGQLYWSSALGVKAYDLESGLSRDIATDAHGLYADAMAADAKAVVWADAYGTHTHSDGVTRTVWAMEPPASRWVTFVGLDERFIWWLDDLGTLRRAARP